MEKRGRGRPATGRTGTKSSTYIKKPYADLIKQIQREGETQVELLQEALDDLAVKRGYEPVEER